METVIVVCVIALTIIVIALLVLLGILLYNQMLATNEVNKRLLLIARESIDRERSTQEELQQALIDLDRETNENQNSSAQKENNDTVLDDDPTFNAHTYQEEYRED